jgi:HTH-type transcriptional regulator/antitoxin HigA
MADTKGYAFVPDEPVAPGETIAEILSERGITQADFALRLGRTEKNVSQLVTGIAPVTHELAISLERVLGVPAEFWNNAESRYRGLLSRAAERERLAEDVQWATQFPLKAMAERGWIARETTPAEQAEEALRFFAVSSPDAWDAYWASPRRLAARMTEAYTVDTPALTAWLRQGELQAATVETAPHDPEGFRQVLGRLRVLTCQDPGMWQAVMRDECAGTGVAVVFVPELPKIRCHAVSRWLTPDKALIQLCLRYRTDDHLWFSFFHEAAHILRHSKKRTFVDDLAGASPEEREADRLAYEWIIPGAELDAFLSHGVPTKATVVEFAERLGIAPSIVVGRLQHDRVIPQSWMNDLKTRLEWAGPRPVR